jgi:hypothetical protein
MAKVPTMSNIWSSYTNLFSKLTRCFEDRTDRLLRIRNGKRRSIHEYLSFRAAVKTDAGTAAAAHSDESKVRVVRDSGVTGIACEKQDL